MPVTTLDANTALVVIDMQKGVIARPTVHPANEVLGQVVRLVDAFRAHNRPVVLVNVGFSADHSDFLKLRTQAPSPTLPLPPDFSDYVDELQADAQRDILIRKRQWGAFYGTDLDLQLRRRGVTNIVLCGISTSIGVESTARDAWERGYNLTFASDAMTDTAAENHERSINAIFPRLGEVGTTAEILAFV